MGETNNPLSGKIDVDVSNVKDGLAQLSRSIREVESSFRASAASLGNWAQTSEGLEKREKALTEEIALQQKKVTLLNRAYQQMVAEKGSNSTASEELHIKLNKELATLGKMEGELKRSGTELGQMESGTNKAASGMNNLETQTKQTHQAMSGLKNMLSTMGGVIAGIGLTSLAGAAIQAVSGLGRLVFGTIEGADALDELSQKTGISTTRLQELGYIGKISGVDMDTMSGSLSKMIRSMDAAGNTPAGQAFAELGVATRDANGNLLDSQAVFENTIGALGNVKNETERDAIAMNIFGRSAMDLNPLILMGADGMANMAQEAHNVGAVMSSENVKASADLNDKIDSLKLGAMGLVGTLASALAPGLQTVTDGMSGLLQGVTGVIKGFQQSPEVGQKMLGKLISDITGQIPGLLATGLKIIQGFISGVMAALPTILPLAVNVITQLATFIIQALPMLLDAGVQIVLALVNAIVPMLPTLVQAGIQVILELVNGISQALPTLMPILATVISQIAVILAQNMPLLVEAGMQLLTALIQGLGLALPILIQQIPVILQTLGDAFVAAWPQIQVLGWQLMGQFMLGMLNELGAMTTVCQDLLNGISTALRDGFHNMEMIGVDLVKSVWQGMQIYAKTFYAQVFNYFLQIKAQAFKALNMGSPSKDFIEIGQNIASSVGIGFADSIRNVERGISSTIGGMNGSGALAGGGVYSPQSNTNYYFGPVYMRSEGSDYPGSQNDNRVLRY